MTGAIPLLPLYVFMIWTGATLTVVKKYGGTRNHALWTAGHGYFTSVPFGWETRWTPQSFWTVAEKSKSLAPAGI